MPDVLFTTQVDYNIILDKLQSDFFKRWKQTKPSRQTGIDNYIIIYTVGAGAFGKVHLVQDKHGTDNYYAVKQLSKEQIVKTKQTAHVLSEKKVLYSIEFPFCISLIDSAKDFDNLYLILPFISGGELFQYHRKVRKFSEKQARFYASQVFLALEYLHYCKLLYRDLKPENIMIDNVGYLKLTDFGFAKRVDGRTNTLCGTPEYLPPEVIQSKPYGTSVDWWAFGVLVYEFVYGSSPFSPYARDVLVMYNKICEGAYKVPLTFSLSLRDLVGNLLQVDTSKRLGSIFGGEKDIKDHEWFKGTDWIGILTHSVESPYVPKITSPNDVTHFSKVQQHKPKPKGHKDHFEMEFASF